MASELVSAATSDKLKEMDWTKNIEICELVATNHGLAKDVIKSIKKRLASKNPNTQLYAVLLLEMLMNNCGDHIHNQVIDNGLLPILVKIVKKKNDLPVRERIFLLLDATQTSLGGASGRFPQYYTAYYELVSARVQFPQRPQAPTRDTPAQNANTNSVPLGKAISTEADDAMQQEATQVIPDSSIIEKASSVMEVLREVLDAIDPQHPEGASDEFTLDLVEQCSFQKQRLMHLIMTSRDEKLVSQAIELNEKLHKILIKHDDLLSVHPTPTAMSISHEEEEEEDTDRLLRRLRKGKACAEEQTGMSQPPYLLHHGENGRRPLARPLCIEPSNHVNSNVTQEKHAPPAFPHQPVSNGAIPTPTLVIPPPPAKYTEREKFFKEKQVDGLPGHMRGLSLHSQTGSSSRSSSSTEFPDREHLNLRE